MYAVVRVIETNQFFSDEDDFTLVKPSLKVEQVGQLQVSLQPSLQILTSKLKGGSLRALLRFTILAITRK